MPHCEQQLSRRDLLERLFVELGKADIEHGDRAEIMIRLKLTTTEVLREIYETGAIRDTIAKFKRGEAV